MRDPIVGEIRRFRDEYARKFNYDLDAIFEDLKDKQRQSGRKAVTLKPRQPKPLHAAK